MTTKTTKTTRTIHRPKTPKTPPNRNDPERLHKIRTEGDHTARHTIEALLKDKSVPSEDKARVKTFLALLDGPEEALSQTIHSTKGLFYKAIFHELRLRREKREAVRAKKDPWAGIDGKKVKTP